MFLSLCTCCLSFFFIFFFILSKGVWLCSWKADALPKIKYLDQVLEALCFGWIDSTIKTEGQKRVQLFTPRSKNSNWTRLNKQRVAQLEELGKMTDSGRRKVQEAKQNGMWELAEQIEDLVEPPALRDALDEVPKARKHWDKFSTSCKKQTLIWIYSAKKQETKHKRIAELVAKAKRNERVFARKEEKKSMKLQ